MSDTIATAFVQIRPRTTGFQGEMNQQVTGATKGLAGTLAKTVGTLVSGAVVAKGVKDILSIGIAYRDSLNTFQAVTGATKSQMLEVSATAKQLGNDIKIPGASAADAADAMTELARSGLSVQDSMNAAKGSLQLAAAGEVSAKDAADLMAASLNTFALKGTDAVRVADLLAATANNTASGVADLAEGVQSAGSVSAAAGYSINEVTTALGELSNAGLSGERAGTTLRSLIISLEKPSKKAKTALKDLGVSMYDSRGKALPLVDVIGQFQRGVEHLTVAQKNQAFAQIAGTYGLSALNILVGKGAGAYLKLENANLKQGAASDLASAKMKGLGGSLRGLQNTAETAAISIFQKFSPSLERGVISVNDFLGSLTASKGFGRDLSAAADFATNSVEQLVHGFQDLVGIAQTLSPVLTPALEALGGAGVGPILVTIATYKALGAVQTGVAAGQTLVNTAMGRGAAPAATLDDLLVVLARNEQAAAGAATEMATTTNAAAVAQERLSFASRSSSITGFSTSLSGVSREAASAERGAAGLAPEIERIGAGAAVAAPASEGLVAGLIGMVNPVTALIGGTALVAGGLYLLSQRAGAAQRAAQAANSAFSSLAASSHNFAQAGASVVTGKQSVSDAEVQRSQSKIGIDQANAQVAADRKRGASSLQLRSDLIAVKVANEQWRNSNSAVLTAQAAVTKATNAQKAAAEEHQKLIGKVTGELTKQGQVESDEVVREARLKNAALGNAAAQKSHATALAAARAEVAKYAASADALSASYAKSNPVLSKATGFVASFTRETKKTPTRTEVAFILNNTKAKTTFSQIDAKLKAYEAKQTKTKIGLDPSLYNTALSQVIAQATGKGTTIGADITSGINAGYGTIDISGPLEAKVNAAIKAAEAKIEKGSPSRRTAREIGKPMIEGIAVGITANAQTANRAAGDAMDMLSRTMKAKQPLVTRTAGDAAAGIKNTFIKGLSGFQASAAKALDFNKFFTENIRGAITSARQNLTTLGSGISSSIGTYLDAQNTKALGTLADHTDAGNPEIKRLATALSSLTTTMANRAHDAVVKAGADAIVNAKKSLDQLVAQGGPDSFSVTAADDAVQQAQESIQTLQDTQAESRENLTDALIKARQDLDTAVNGTPGTTTTTDTSTDATEKTSSDYAPATAGNPGRQIGTPFSSGVKIAGTYVPATDATGSLTDTDATSSSTSQTTGAVAPLDALGQRAAARQVADAQRALTAFDSDYKRQLDAANKEVHDSTAARTQLDLDYTQSVKDAQQALTDAQSAQLDQQNQDKSDSLSKQLDAAVAAQQAETDNAKTQLQIQLDDLTSALNNKQITLQQFQQSVLGDINAVAPGWQAAGATLGTSFVTGIQQSIASLLQQASLLQGGPSGVAPGDTSPEVTDPAQTQRQDFNSLKSTLIEDRNAVSTALAAIAKDTTDARGKKSEGGTSITKAEQQKIDQDTADTRKALRDLTAAMRALNVNQGAGLKIDQLTLNDDPDKAVSDFLKRLAANTNR